MGYCSGIEFFLVILLFNLTFSQIIDGSRDQRIICEPKLPKSHQNETIWISKYNMTFTPSGFIGVNVHKSSYVLPYPVAGIDRERRANKAHFYYEVLNVKRTGSILPFRSMDSIIWHFLHGDSMIFHTINRLTKEYSKTEIGFHTNKLYFVTEADVWFAQDFPQHSKKQSAALIGLTLFRNRKNSSFIFPSREEMLQEYPMHSEIINKIYNRKIE